MSASRNNRPDPKHLWLLARAAGLCVLLFFVSTEVGGQTDGPGRKKTVAGVVKKFRTDIRTGQIDGVFLDDGTIVVWWPHLSKRFTAIIHKGDRVEVTGRLTTTPQNVTVVEADIVTNLTTKKSALNDDDPLPLPKVLLPPAVARPVLPLSKTVTGTVKRLTTAPNKEIDGMVLTDGTVVRWPSRWGKRIADMVGTEDKVMVTGRPAPTAGGKSVLEAAAVTNAPSRATVVVGLVRRTETPPVPVVPERPERTKNPKNRTVWGIVKQFATTREGVIGIVLDNGDQVRWPVGQEKRFTSILARGDRVEVIGREETLPSGKIVLWAGTVINLTTKARAVAEEGSPRVLKPPTSSRIDDLEKRVRLLEDKVERLSKVVESLQRQR